MNNVKKSIGWSDWSINPVKGLCPVGCSYCYARRFYQRGCNSVFKDETIRYDDSVWESYNKASAGSRVFIGSTIELFHKKTIGYLDEIMKHLCPDLINIFLTKCPQNLPHDWPDNYWVGVSATNYIMYAHARWNLTNIKAKVKFISFEPLLDRIADGFGFPLRPELLDESGINWVIIGAQTPFSKKTAPNKLWIDEIEDACKKADIPYFEKNNLTSLLNRELVQDFPKLN